MESNLAIKINDVSKTFTVHEQGNTIRGRLTSLFTRKRKSKIKALDKVSLEIKKGEMFGIVGHNGSGKSTLIQIMNETIYPDKGGKVEVFGKCMRLALGVGFSPQLTARQNINLSCSVLGLTKKEIRESFDEIIKFAELEDYIDVPAKFYSSGMKSKLMFSIAVNAKADIFLMDEFFGGVGDENFRKKADQLFHDRLIKGKTIVLVSHQIETIKKYCDRVGVFEQGRLVKIGKPSDIL